MERSQRLTAVVAMAAASMLASSAGAQEAGSKPEPALRPPAVPLVASDPYLSIWSMAYRLMGAEPRDVPPMRQTALHIFPTRTIYDFDDGHVHVTLTFMTPSLPDDLDVLARPLTYLTWGVRSIDGAAHAVSIYDSTSALLAVNTPEQRVEWRREAIADLTALRAGTVDQTLLQPAGDDTRIDWGYVYVAASSEQA